jgi:hypothetical protein
MPTSGTGSLWRLVNAIGGDNYRYVKISEELENSGQGAKIATWVPETHGHIYLYNTPHFVNPKLADTDLKLIVNFRDPRDLACNQYHWALQHPVANQTLEDIEQHRRSVAENGIDNFVAKQDNNILFNSIKVLASRLQSGDPHTLNLSYGQLCLDFDNVVRRLIRFLGVAEESVPWDQVELERTGNLKRNPNWIGQLWSGADIMPGRYRTDLSRQTIAIVDDRYRENLKLVRSLEVPRLRSLLATEVEREEMERVLVGLNDELFLQKDANNTVAQITGELRCSTSDMVKIGMAHLSRQWFGATVGNFRYRHAIIPSKEVAHRGSLPPEVLFERFGARPVKRFVDEGIGALWRPFYEPALLEPRAGERFYPQTDSHWNHDGAFRYLNAFLLSVDAATAAQMASVPLRRFAGRQQGDLGLKLELPPDVIEVIAPTRPYATLVFENGIVNEGCIRWYRNDNVGGGKRVFVMHDSFTLWLLGIIPELFSEVVFFHGTTFDYEFVRRFAPALVMCIQAERFFIRIPDTGGDMMDFVERQEREKKAPRRLAEFIASDPRFQI